MKYGPFSDGEADTLKKGRLDCNDQILDQIVPFPGNRSCRKSTRGRGNELITPHYATMSRVQQANSRQSSLDQDSCVSSQKYTSQPQLNSHLLSDFIGQRAPPHFPANSEALTPLSLKTSITFPRKLPPPSSSGAQQQRYPSEKPAWNGKTGPVVGRIPLHQDRLRQLDSQPSQNSQLAQPYPDLARHPLSYSQVPPPPNKRTTPLRYSMMQPTVQYSGGVQPGIMSRSLIQPGQTSSDDNPHEYEHSRSSSVGDIPVGMNGHNPDRMATPDGYASLPYDSTLPTTTRPPASIRERRKSSRCGAVRVDLSFAGLPRPQQTLKRQNYITILSDKSIRRPGSAPDLVNNDEGCNSQHSPGGTSVRSGGAKKMGGLIDRGRSTSSERETLLKKLGGPGTPGTRKVAFAGIDDDDDESDTESEDKDTVNSFDEEVWVKQPESLKVEDPVPTTGLIVAGGTKAQPPNLTNGNVVR